MAQKMFSRRGEEVIGTFHHGHALIEANQSVETIELIEDPTRISMYLNDSTKQFKILLEFTAVMHERLHYLDTFGTFAGISIFSARMLALRRFVESAIEIVATGGVWQLPMSKWVSSGKAPEVIRKLSRFARGFRAGTDLFLAPFSPFGIHGHTEKAWIEVPFPTTGENGKLEISKVPAFPMSVAFGQYESDKWRPITIVMPLGYEAIVEGIAHGISRSVVLSMFPDLPPSTMQHYGAPKNFTEEEVDKDLDAVARQFEIYTASDLMISKFLRAQGTYTFPRRLVFKLSDIALSLSYFQVEDLDDKNTSVGILNPGTVLTQELTAESAENLAKGEVAYPEIVMRAYQNLLDGLTSQGDWNTVTPMKNSLYTAHRVWESFVAQNITVPLLRSRIESDHEKFNSESELINSAMSMNLPRVELYNGNLQFHGMPDEVRNAWGQQLFTSEIAQQVFADGEIIRCPRAHGLVTGIERADFSDGGCAKHKRLGCGTFIHGQPGYTPICLFNNALQSFGFTPTHSPNGVNQ